MRVVVDVSRFWDWKPVVGDVDQYYRWEPTTQVRFELIDGPALEFDSPESAAEHFAEHPDDLPPGRRLANGTIEAHVTDEHFRSDQQGNTLIRVEVAMASYTEIVLPPQQVQNVIDAPAYDSVTEPNESVAWWVARMMAHNAPREAWTDIHVDGDPELEGFLRQRFGFGATK